MTVTPGDALAPWDAHENPRMEAYYYGFVPTGNAAVDWVLHAVAVAGKGAHSTEAWNDEDDNYLTSHGLRGSTFVEAIQNAAVDAAAHLATAPKAAETKHERVVLATVDGHEDAWCPECAEPYDEAHPDVAVAAEALARVRAYLDRIDAHHALTKTIRYDDEIHGLDDITLLRSDIRIIVGAPPVPAPNAVLAADGEETA